MIYFGDSMMMAKVLNFSSMRASISYKSRLYFGPACKRIIFVNRWVSKCTLERTYHHCSTVRGMSERTGREYLYSVSDVNISPMQSLFLWLHLLLLLAGYFVSFRTIYCSYQ